MNGTAWGVALWLMAQLVVMAMMGGGVFSSNMSGMMAAMGSLVVHVLYGSLLGAIASAPDTRLAPMRDNRRRVRQGREWGKRVRSGLPAL